MSGGQDEAAEMIDTNFDFQNSSAKLQDGRCVSFTFSGGHRVGKLQCWPDGSELGLRDQTRVIRCASGIYFVGEHALSNYPASPIPEPKG